MDSRPEGFVVRRFWVLLIKGVLATLSIVLGLESGLCLLVAAISLYYQEPLAFEYLGLAVFYVILFLVSTCGYVSFSRRASGLNSAKPEEQHREAE